MLKVPADKKLIRTRTAEIWLEDGLVRSLVLPGSEQTLQDAQDSFAALEELTDGKKMPSYSDSSGLKSVTREARQFYAKARSSQQLSAVAVLVSPVSRVIIMFFQKFNKPPYPIKYFSNEEDALAWIEQYK